MISLKSKKKKKKDGRLVSSTIQTHLTFKLNGLAKFYIVSILSIESIILVDGLSPC